MQSRSQITALINRYSKMDYCPQRLDAFLQTKAMADENGDPWCRIACCYHVAWAYIMADDSAKALPYCAEFFSLSQENPDHGLRPLFQISIAEQATGIALSLPQIPKAQCKALLDQLESLSLKYNLGKRIFYQQSFWYYFTMGQMEEAQQSFDRFQKAPIDEVRSCKACNLGTMVSALLLLGRRAEAEEAAKPILNGTLLCKEGCQPSNVLLDLLDKEICHQEWEKAEINAKRLLAIGFEDRGDLDCLSQVLLWCALTGAAETRSLFEKGAAWTLGVWDKDSLFYFYRAAWKACVLWANTQTQIELSLPSKFPLYAPDGLYTAATMAKEFYEMAAQIAQQFDQRDGTEWHQGELDVLLHITK